MGKLNRLGFELHQAALEGDKILNQIVRGWCKKYGVNKVYPDTSSQLISNEIISNFKIGFKHRRTSVKTKGDMVEAWIYWLYCNYGEERVKQYLIKEYKKVLKQLENG